MHKVRKAPNQIPMVSHKGINKISQFAITQIF
jgi:hypothetical protein